MTAVERPVRSGFTMLGLGVIDLQSVHDPISP